MSIQRERARRVLGAVCLGLGLGVAAPLVASAGAEPTRSIAAVAEAPAPPLVLSVKPPTEAAPPALAARPPRDLAPRWITDEGGHPVAVVYPARDASPESSRPVVVAFHGICSDPAWECGAYTAVTDHAWLVCPRATTRCDNGGGIWSARDDATAIDAIVARASLAFPGEIEAAHGRTLLGFSLGARPAADIAQHGDGRYAGAILVSADVSVDASLLKRAGVGHVVTASGEYDMMRYRMSGLADRLHRSGVDASFLSLGKIGHTLPATPDWLREAMGRIAGSSDEDRL